MVKEKIESKMLKNILRAAKESKNPSSIAQAYGILVDKIAKCSQKFSKEIKGILGELLSEIDRAADASNSPDHIAIAFGILVDKKTIGIKNEDESTARPIAKEKDRLKLYEELDRG